MEKFTPKRWPVLVTTLALITAYALAYFYEKSLLRLLHDPDLPFMGPYWQVDLAASIAPLIVLVVIAALAWLGLCYLPPSRIAAALFIFPGLFTIGLHYYHYLSYLSSDFFFPMWLSPQTILGQIRLSFMNFGALGYASTIHYLAAGCILIGIVILWKVKKDRQDAAQED